MLDFAREPIALEQYDLKRAPVDLPIDFCSGFQYLMIQEVLIAFLNASDLYYAHVSYVTGCDPSICSESAVREVQAFDLVVDPGWGVLVVGWADGLGKNPTGIAEMWAMTRKQCDCLQAILKRGYPDVASVLRIEPILLAVEHKKVELCVPSHVPLERVLGNERLFDLPTAVDEIIESLDSSRDAPGPLSVKEMVESLLALGHVHDLDLYDLMPIVMPSEWIDRIPGCEPS
jgi:hypothetical protein